MADEIDRRAQRAVAYIKRRVSEGGDLNLLLDGLSGVDADLRPYIEALLWQDGFKPVPQPPRQRRATPAIRRPSGGNLATIDRSPFASAQALRQWRSHFPDIEATGPSTTMTSSYGNVNRKASVPGGITKSVPSNMVRK
jgi:hypothetical protein